MYFWNLFAPEFMEEIPGVRIKERRGSGMAEFLITFFLGIFGVHRFMQRKYVTGFIWLFTMGVFGIGWFVDVCIAFSHLVKGGEDKKVQITTESQTEAGQRQAPFCPENGEKKGFWASWKENAIKSRQEAAIRDAYKKEEEKRKPQIKKIRHTRALTPQEQQSIDTLNMEITKLYNEYRSKKSSYNDYLWGSLRFENQIKEIRKRAEWYESIELPPEVDPDTPIFVDEEAIRNSITGLF